MGRGGGGTGDGVGHHAFERAVPQLADQQPHQERLLGVRSLAEQFVQRLRAGLPEAERPPLLDTIYAASVEIRGSIVYATAIIIVVFLPLFFFPPADLALGAVFTLLALAAESSGRSSGIWPTANRPVPAS